MIQFVFVLCTLPVALSLDALEMAHDTAKEYRLTAMKGIFMAVCFSFFSIVVPVVCSGIFGLLFRALHVLDFIIPKAFIDFLVPLGILLFFGITGGKKIVFGSLEFAGKASPDNTAEKIPEEASVLLLFLQAFAASTDMSGAGLLMLLAEVNSTLAKILKTTGILSGFRLVLLIAGITSLLTFLFSLIGSFINIGKTGKHIPQGLPGIFGGAVILLSGVLLIFI